FFCFLLSLEGKRSTLPSFPGLGGSMGTTGGSARGVSGALSFPRPSRRRSSPPAVGSADPLDGPGGPLPLIASLNRTLRLRRGQHSGDIQRALRPVILLSCHAWYGPGEGTP